MWQAGDLVSGYGTTDTCVAREKGMSGRQARKVALQTPLAPRFTVKLKKVPRAIARSRVVQASPLPPRCGAVCVTMDEHDLYMNLFVALAIMACILLPQFMFRAPTTTAEKKHG